jgi:hypothetical protein
LKAKKSILFITVTFPPRLSVASLRLYNYARLFVKNGWNVTVLTSKQLGETTSREFEFEGIEVIHVPWNDPFDKIQKIKNVFARKIAFKTLNIFVPYLATWLPDRRFKSWRINTLVVANKIINEKQIKFIYSSFSPPSPHLIASQLKRKFPHLYWISEYRDLWSHSHSNNLCRTYFADFHFSFEKKVISHSDLVLTVSEGHRQFLNSKISIKIHVLYNGCDFDSYTRIESKKENGVFCILYTGNIYKKAYDVGLFFKSFKKFLENPTYNNSEMHFIGTPETDFLKALIQKYDLKEKVIFHNKKTNAEIKVLQKNADVLLQFVWNNPKQPGNLTGKLFEYIAARKPILVVGDEKEVGKLISDTESGKMCSHEETIVLYLESIFLSKRASLKTIENRDSKISKENQFALLESLILGKKDEA